jgi:hypothetical protein
MQPHVAQHLPSHERNTCRSIPAERCDTGLLALALAVFLLGQMLLLSRGDAVRVRACTHKQRSVGCFQGGEISRSEMNPPSLLIVSIHSSYGSESNTIPPWPIVSCASKTKRSPTYPCLEVGNAVFD